ncbi:MAG: hypothetical protein BJ554DRAFT_2162, partial [Olpidium bornovanus]
FKTQFAAPGQPGVYQFRAHFKSDSYAGSDVTQDVKVGNFPCLLHLTPRVSVPQLIVQDPSVLPEEPEVDDDISEPDEDTIAGQMELIRKQGLTGAMTGGAGGKGGEAGGEGSKADRDDDSETDSD